MPVIERFEEDICILELNDGSHLEIGRDLIPAEAIEGDFLEKTENGYIVNKDKTERLRREITELQNILWE